VRRRVAYKLTEKEKVEELIQDMQTRSSKAHARAQRIGKAEFSKSESYVFLVPASRKNPAFRYVAIRSRVP
jgi:hypothetical protein